MVKLKLKIAKSKRINPATKKMGLAARVITDGDRDGLPTIRNCPLSSVAMSSPRST